MGQRNLNINGIEFSITSDKTSWGDGTHETTAFMLDAVSRYNVKDKTVLDIGTGSGVLSVLCSKLGARNVFAIDTNPNVLEFAKRNFLANGTMIFPILNDLTEGMNYKYDVVLANLERDVQIRNVATVGHVLKDDGIFIMTWKNTDPFEQFVKGFEIIERVAGKEYDGYVLKKRD